MKWSARLVVPAVVIFGVLLLLYSRHFGINFAEHERFDNGLDQLRDFDRILSLDVLEARFHMLADYDDFTACQTRLREEIETVKVVPAFVPPAEQVPLRAKVAEIERLMDERAQLLESFKTANAVLNNSLRYLPVASSELLEQLTKDPANHGLEVRMNELMQLVLVHNLNPGEEQTPAIQRSLSHLAEWGRANPTNPYAPAVSGISAHVASIVSRKPKIEALTLQILSIPTHAAVQELNDLYGIQLAAALRRVDRIRNTLTVGCVLLLLGIGFALYAVNEARRNLKQRVEERTRDLRESNGALETEKESLRESEMRFRQMAENIEQVFWMTSPTGDNVIYVSPAYERIWGRSCADLHANPHEWMQAIVAEDQPRTVAALGKVAEGEIYDIEYRITRSDGSSRWIRDRGFPVRNAAGGVVRVCGIAEDVTARKEAEMELNHAERKLRESSRQAGMAEVATSVLHNVGNVLNSVNVSAALVVERVKKSKITALGRVVGLLDAHAADIGDFISRDPQGSTLPGFLRKLNEQLAGEQRGALSELESLRSNIEHIKDIVAMQQNYAKVTGVAEIVNVADLVEDSLRMNAGALTRHNVSVQRDYQEIAPISVDKHKVLQILVNLIRNAKYACDDAGGPEKVMTLRVVNGGDTVKISVIDNGVGIPAENLARIFNHGFTTRKEGHGFGLHSGALAAVELGGALRVHSDGPGRGATFTLELPARTASTQPAPPNPLAA